MTLLIGSPWSRRSPDKVPPGPQTWGGGRLLAGLGRSLENFKPVLALTVIRWSDRGPEILVGVRNPETNQTHQNVASVPTRRVGITVARTWVRRLRYLKELSEPERADLVEAVSHTFSLKLGLAEALEHNQVGFEVRDFAAHQGISVIGEEPGGAPVTENLTMFNAYVELRDPLRLLPNETASYRPLVWARVDDFIAMSNTHDTGRLNAGLEDAFYCAYGLCLQTSVRMLDRFGPESRA